MDLSENVGGTDRTVRALLAAALGISAIRALRRGKRTRGLLLAGGALVAVFTSTTKYCPVNEWLGIDTSEGGTAIDIEETESDGYAADSSTETTTGDADAPTTPTADRRTLTCAFCGDPIVPGQGRGPNAQGDIVHETCE